MSSLRTALIMGSLLLPLPAGHIGGTFTSRPHRPITPRPDATSRDTRPATLDGSQAAKAALPYPPSWATDPPACTSTPPRNKVRSPLTLNLRRIFIIVLTHGGWGFFSLQLKRSAWLTIVFQIKKKNPFTKNWFLKIGVSFQMIWNIGKK